MSPHEKALTKVQLEQTLYKVETATEVSSTAAYHRPAAANGNASNANLQNVPNVGNFIYQQLFEKKNTCIYLKVVSQIAK